MQSKFHKKVEKWRRFACAFPSRNSTASDSPSAATRQLTLAQAGCRKAEAVPSGCGNQHNAKRLLLFCLFHKMLATTRRRTDSQPFIFYRSLKQSLVPAIPGHNIVRISVAKADGFPWERTGEENPSDGAGNVHVMFRDCRMERFSLQTHNPSFTFYIHLTFP